MSIFFFALILSGCGTSVNQNIQNHSDHSTPAANIEKLPEIQTSNSEIPAKQFSIDLKTNPPTVEANKVIELTFSIRDNNGAQIKDFKVVHEKKMHLILVSSDLSEFEHLHPEIQKDGSFKIKYSFKHGGKFILFSDVTPQDGSQTVERLEINVKGNEISTEKLVADSTLTKQLDGISVTMKPDGELTSNQETAINFDITDQSTEKPVKDLQNYLGALAHIVIISEDTQDFLHVHPMDNNMPDKTSVMAHTIFPRGGIYKVWTQFQRNNKVIVVPFVVNVTQGTAEIISESKSENGITRIKVNKDGYTPSTISVKKGEPLKLLFLREDDKNCGDEVVFSSLNIKKPLPVGQETAIEINPTETGEINFSCGMNMLRGKIIVQ